MRTTTLISLLALSLCLAKPVLAQTGAHNHFKYWVYEDRLEEIFVKIGYVPPPANGIYDHGYNYSIPTPSVKVHKNEYPGKHWLRFGDGIAETGWHLCALATEYELLRQQGLPTDSTLRRIALAIEALYRLDMMAEQVPPYTSVPFGSGASPASSNLNGLLLRNDAQIFAYSSHDSLMYPASLPVGADDGLYAGRRIDNNGNLVRVSGWPIRNYADNPWPTPGDVPSDDESFDYNYIGQDQFTWLLNGLAAVRRFIPDDPFMQIDLNGDGNTEPYWIRGRMKQMVVRIMDNLQEDDYLFIAHGITRDGETYQMLGKTGGNARLFSYGLQRAAIYVCDEQDNGRWTRGGLNQFGSWLLWQRMRDMAFLTAVQGAITSTFNSSDDFIGSSFSYAMIVSLATVGRSWFETIPIPGFSSLFFPFNVAAMIPALLLNQNIFSLIADGLFTAIYDGMMDDLNVPAWLAWTVDAIVAGIALVVVTGIMAYLSVTTLVVAALTLPLTNSTSEYVNLACVGMNNHFFPAYYQVLHDEGGNLFSESDYEFILDRAPCFGPHFSCPAYPDSGCYTTHFGCEYYGWASDNRFRQVDAVDLCSHQSEHGTIPPTRYCGLDYLCMLNVYRLRNPDHFLRYDNFRFNDINIDFPWSAPNGTIYGNIGNPALQYGQTYVRPRSTCHSGAVVQFVASEGGEVNADFLYTPDENMEVELKYENVECQDDFGGRMAAPNSSTGSRMRELPAEQAPASEYTLGEVLGWRQHFIDSLHFTSQEADTLFTDGLIPSPDLMQRLLEVVDPSMNPNPAPAPPNVQIYPNPCADRLSVSCDRAYPGVYNCTLLNANLQELARFTVGGENCTTVLGVTNFPRGIYTLRIEIPGSETLHVKVVLN